MIETRFKDTEIGKIPEEWEVTQISSLGKVITGSTPPRNNRDLWKGNFSWISAQDFKGKYIMDSTEKISEEGKSFCRILPVNSVLVTCIASIGLNAISKISCATNQQINAIICDQDNSPEFVYYQICNNNGKLLELAGQTAVPIINKGQFENVKIASPKSLSEQRRIATALSNVDALIAAVEKKIEKKKLIKQGAMQQLLTGKKRLNGYKGEWSNVNIGSLCKLYGRIGFRGYTKNDLVEKGMGAITFSPSDIHDFKLSFDDCDYISFNKYEESPEIKVFNGDILFCKTASIGKCAIVTGLNEKATINPQFVVMKDFKCDNHFLYYKLIDDDYQAQVLSITGGSTIPTMSQEKLKEQRIFIPIDISEQRAIASILSNMDSEITALERKRDKLKELKQGMMQQLLTGKIRLV